MNRTATKLKKPAPGCSWAELEAFAQLIHAKERTIRIKAEMLINLRNQQAEEFELEILKLKEKNV